MLKYSLLCLILASSYVFADEAVEPVQTHYLDRFSVSTGLGIPYSILGINLNYRVLAPVELFAGVGTWGSSYGVRVFPISQIPKFHLSISHGINTIVDSCHNNLCDILEEGYAGYNAAFGVSPEQGESGWEFDVIFILSRENYDEDIEIARKNGFEIEEDDSKITLSFGYRWHF